MSERIDVFALRDEIADLTRRFTDHAAAMRPLIDRYRRIGDVLCDLAEAGAFRGGIAEEQAAYEDWRQITGDYELAAVVADLVKELER